LKGINAAVVGIMAASTVFLSRDISFANLVDSHFAGLMQIAIIAITFILLMFTRVPAPVIALLCLALGFVF
jgi:chromate transporter